MGAPADKAGASQAPAEVPAMLIIRQQGRSKRINASPTKIGRMLLQIYDLEQEISDYEKLPRYNGKRMFRVGGKFKNINPVKALANAQRARDEHIEDIRQLIDYAQTVDGYHEVDCPGCHLPADPLEFAAQLPDFDYPAMCETCKGAGRVRQKKQDRKSRADRKRIAYYKRELENVRLAAKVRADTLDSSEAFAQLEAKCERLAKKLSNEKQTALEWEDALQGVRQGIVEAAHKFDPTQKQMAAFTTVAYWWAFRNSRPRHPGQKRPGLYAPSVDGMHMGTDLEGKVSTLVHQSVGALGKLVRPTGRASGAGHGDSCKKCGDVAEIDPDTWQPTGFCAPCAAVQAKAKPKKEEPEPGRDYDGGGERVSCPRDLLLDLRDRMSKLPDAQQTVLRAEMDGQQVQEIAQTLGCSTVTVRRLRESAYETLRATMLDYAESLRD